MAASRAQRRDASQADRILQKARLKKEKEDTDARATALRIIALIGKLSPRMLSEETAAVRAIMEPYTQPVDQVARLSQDALIHLVESGDLVEDQEEEDPEAEAQGVTPVPPITPVTPIRREDVLPVLLHTQPHAAPAAEPRPEPEVILPPTIPQWKRPVVTQHDTKDNQT